MVGIDHIFIYDNSPQGKSSFIYIEMSRTDSWIGVPHLNASTSTLTKEKQGIDIQLLGKFQIGGFWILLLNEEMKK